MKKFPVRNIQEERARLVSPFFNFLAQDPTFLKDAEALRSEYGLGGSPENRKIPQDAIAVNYWEPDFEAAETLRRYGEGTNKEMARFHSDVERLAEKHLVPKFPILVKEFVLTERFGDVLVKWKLVFSGDTWTASGSRFMKKEDFEEIWSEIRKRNAERPESGLRVRFSDEILAKSDSAKSVENKYFANQKLFRTMLSQRIGRDVSIEQERTISSTSKYEKSRMKQAVSDLVSLLEDLSEAE